MTANGQLMSCKSRASSQFSHATAVKAKFYITDQDWRDLIEIYENDRDMD
jgi:hypothetical protein